MCWCSWSIIPQRSPLKDGNIEFAQILRTKLSVLQEYEVKQSLMPWFEWYWQCRTYILGLFPVLPILMQKYWIAPLSNLVEKILNWSIWHLTAQNNQFRCKRTIFFDGFYQNQVFLKKIYMSIFHGYWRQCWKWVGAKNIVFCSLADLCYHRFYCPAITCCVFLTDAIT